MSFNILSPFVASPGTRSTYLTDLCKDIPLFFFFFFFFTIWRLYHWKKILWEKTPMLAQNAVLLILILTFLREMKSSLRLTIKRLKPTHCLPKGRMKVNLILYVFRKDIKLPTGKVLIFACNLIWNNISVLGTCRGFWRLTSSINTCKTDIKKIPAGHWGNQHFGKFNTFYHPPFVHNVRL